MLARHAENLYWIGRYLERAENTVRMLEVTYQAGVEAHDTRPESELWAELLEVLFLEDEMDATSIPGDEIGLLLLADGSSAASVTSLVRRTRDNARAAREWLSSEMWEAINVFYLDLLAENFPRTVSTQPYDVFRRLKAGCQSILGAAEATMSRGEVYRFTQLGRMLERSAISTRMLSVWHHRLGGFTGSAAFTEWVKLLRSMGAYESYLRIHQASMTPSLVLEFLLRSAEFPRSTLHAVSRAEQHLLALAGNDVGQASLRSVGRLRSSVEYTESVGLGKDELAGFLHSLEGGILQLALSIETDYFHALAADEFLHSYEVF